ncbi:Protein of unknown function [Quadrisphaera granulorum]|uniref:Uncharacterized protein DUF742 n=1 Tax=Quadrisphaera granulorum TaxID=317664 RepID=A0A316AD05_9ACTN|nr:DUF742 domain-containing protein [Quadrisphaera granulorum]PWJ55666.1 uncharacterized protein DUF742 [Quadrisphaera granulorum]SZE95163.1 Protein of unknown function [Quadrisphaera granulorum]
MSARHPGSHVAAGSDDSNDDGEDLPTVRPYAVAGGRRAPSATELPLEALVQALSTPLTGMTRECRRILELTASGWLSVAELSAHVRLPVPVARVVIGDLQRQGAVRVHAPVLPPADRRSGTADRREWVPTSDRRLLESVLDGISTL